MTKTSITSAVFYEIGGYSPPFTLNNYWDGIRKRRYKTEVKVYAGWVDNNLQFETVHYITAYIQPEAREFVSNLLEYSMLAARFKFRCAFAKNLFLAMQVEFVDLGTAKNHFESETNPFLSIFIHDADDFPRMKAKNYPRVCPLRFDPDSSLWSWYAEYRRNRARARPTVAA